MTTVPTYKCDDCEEQFDEDLINEFEVRSGVHDPIEFTEPYRRRLHLCDRCLGLETFDTSSVDYIGYDPINEEVVGASHKLRSFAESESYTRWDKRDSVMFGYPWDAFFDRVEEVVRENYIEAI